MKLLVIGAGMMGSAAAYDMARSSAVQSITLADNDPRRAKQAARRIQALLAPHHKSDSVKNKVRAVELDASDEKASARLMRGHNAALSAVPYFFNVGLAKAAIRARCHFADLGGNNTVVRKTYALAREAAKKNVALAPDCGLSPGMASILAGELVRRLQGNANSSRLQKIDALKLYVGGLPKYPKHPFQYQLVFSVEGLINEYVEPARVLKNGKIQEIEPLTEPEDFHLHGFAPLVAFHTSGGTSTMPETFTGQVGECFEKTLRYPDHYKLIRGLYDFGFFSSEKRKFKTSELSPREMTAALFLEKLSGNEPDVCIMRIEAHQNDRVLAFEMVDYFDPKLEMSAMMRTTAWPASIVLQMIAAGVIKKRGAIKQELDVPADVFLKEMNQRGIRISFSDSHAKSGAASRAASEDHRSAQA
ncbi:MAG TPA: saccharopine dehydrogenase C-terminal domain-containing protein [Terriglobales bacterium]